MREIKFRAWEHNTKRMVYGIAVRNSTIKNHKDIFYLPNHKTNYPIMQYTGLKDKNGKEIYEGDIAKMNWSEKNWIVVRNYAQFDIQSNTQQHPLNDINLTDELEVIGNIHENPEL